MVTLIVVVIRLRESSAGQAARDIVAAADVALLVLRGDVESDSACRRGNV